MIQLLSFKSFLVFKMKKIVMGLLFWLSFSSLHAFTLDEIPNEFYVNQHWISYTTSFDIESKTKKLGTLYRKIFSLFLTYELYDPSNAVLATAQARFFSLGAYFDVKNSEGNLLGTVEEKIFTFFPSFTIYSDGVNKLAQAEMNFWGTTFTVYDAATGEEIALMSRQFFRLKNDWTIKIINRELLKARNIDAKLLMIVLAFQGDQEYWIQQQQQNNIRNLKSSASTKVNIQAAQEQINVLASDQDSNQNELPTKATLERIAKQLDSDYQKQVSLHVAEQNAENNSEKLDGFINFCREKIASEKTTGPEKKAIVYLLQKRMGNI